jgi:hypothetical protein
VTSKNSLVTFVLGYVDNMSATAQPAMNFYVASTTISILLDSSNRLQ